jgi:hypothetical protein
MRMHAQHRRDRWIVEMRTLTLQRLRWLARHKKRVDSNSYSYGIDIDRRMHGEFEEEHSSALASCKPYMHGGHACAIAILQIIAWPWPGLHVHIH